MHVFWLLTTDPALPASVTVLLLRDPVHVHASLWHFGELAFEHLQLSRATRQHEREHPMKYPQLLRALRTLLTWPLAHVVQLSVVISFTRY